MQLYCFLGISSDCRSLGSQFWFQRSKVEPNDADDNKGEDITDITGTTLEPQHDVEHSSATEAVSCDTSPCDKSPKDIDETNGSSAMETNENTAGDSDLQSTECVKPSDSEKDTFDSRPQVSSYL